jgi:hypothetical protein
MTYTVYEFCSRYVLMLRLRNAVGPVELVDARKKHPVVKMLKDRNIDLNEGMALVRGEHISHGADCVNELSLLFTSVGAFNTWNVWFFQSTRRARAI